MREHCKSEDIDLDLFPHDIIQLFSSWFTLFDCFDENVSHSNNVHNTVIIDDKQYQTVTKSNDDWLFSSSFGRNIVSKGCKQEWTFNVLHNNWCNMLLGIIDNDKLINFKEAIGEFSDETHGGYSVWLASYPCKYHANAQHCGEFEYLKQFQPRKIRKITMILDMTQNECDNGVLSYFVEGEKSNVEAETDVSNVAFDNIDIERMYRFAVCIRNSREKLGLLQM